MARGDHREPALRAARHRDVDELALAGAVALAQGGQDPERGHLRAAAEVGDLGRGGERRAAALAREAEQPVAGEVVDVVPGAVAVGAVLPVAGDRAVDEAGVLRAQPLVADAEPVEHAGAERLEQDVVVADEPQQHLAAFLHLQVEP